MKFKNSDLIPVLSSMLVFDNTTKKPIGGLLTENITLGTKRKLQKIRNEALKHYEELLKDEKEVKETAKPEDLEKELKELFDEEVEINQDFVDISFIEEIKSANNYDFDVIEKFAR